MVPKLPRAVRAALGPVLLTSVLALGCSTVFVEDGAGGAGGAVGDAVSISSGSGTHQGPTTTGPNSSTTTAQSSSSTGRCEPCEGADCPGSHQWSYSYGDGQDQFGGAVASDAAGNVVVAGSFRGSVDFGGGPLVADEGGTLLMPFYIAKLDPQAQHTWSKQLGDVDLSGSVQPLSAQLAIDDGGNVIFAGYFYNSAGGFDCADDHAGIVVKLDGAGTELWRRCFVGQGAPVIHAVAAAPDGDVLVAGQLEGTADFGGGSFSSPNGANAFVVKLDAAGNHVWSKLSQSPGAGARSVAVHDDGTIVVGGGFFSAVDFGGGPLTAEGSDAFVVKLDAMGNHLWSRSAGAAGPSTRADAITLDAAGNVLVTGATTSATSFFGGGPLQTATYEASYVVKLSGSGQHLWSKTFGESVTLAALAIDPSDNVILVENFWGTLNFGGCSFSSANGDGFAIAKLDPSGNHLWSKRSGSTQPTGVVANAVAADPMGNVLVTGWFAGELSLGGQLFTSGYHDLFLVKLAP